MAFLAQPSKLAHILTRRYIAFAAGLLITVFCICNWCHGATFYGPLGGHILKTEASPSNNVFKKLDMTEKECRKTFPGLLDEVDRSSGGGKFQLERAVDDYMGLVQGRISGGKVSSLLFEKGSLVNTNSCTSYLTRRNLIVTCYSSVLHFFSGPKYGGINIRPGTNCSPTCHPPSYPYHTFKRTSPEYHIRPHNPRHTQEQHMVLRSS